MTFTQSICETCGTEIVRDEETGAEAHLDIRYEKCGVEGWGNELIATLESMPQIPEDRKREMRPRRHLRSAK